MGYCDCNRREVVPCCRFELRFAQAFTCAAFEEQVLRNNDRGAAVLIQDGEEVLEEVELFVASCCFPNFFADISGGSGNRGLPSSKSAVLIHSVDPFIQRSVFRLSLLIVFTFNFQN